MKANVINEFIDRNLCTAAETPDWRDIVREEPAGTINVCQAVALSALVTTFLMLIVR